jgi:membrane associated rhomboid family serine protease
MIPLKDNIPSRTTPIINYTMIGVCALAFVVQLVEQTAPPPSLVERFGMIPARVLHPVRPVEIQELVPVGQYLLVPRARIAAEPPFSPWLTLLTCIFLTPSA